MKRSLSIALALLTLHFTLPAQIRPGVPWTDASGKIINAHGGNILYHEGIYYWYGEHKIEGLSEKTHADGGVHCYASNDLKKWRDQGMMIRLDMPPEYDLTHECNSDRPKVVYNKKTKTFVMFFKLYLRGMGSSVGYIGVATSQSPVGPFIYKHKFLGGNSCEGTGDFSMFQDNDGTLYHFAVQKPTKKMVIGKMRDDYLMPEGEYHICEGITPKTEAPAIFRYGNTYYMFASGTSGWAPNAARSFSAKKITGEWTELGNPLKGTNPHNGLSENLSFGGQANYVFKIPGKHERFVAMLDINKPEHPFESLYIWLPVHICDGRFEIIWKDDWDIADIRNYSPQSVK